MLLEINDLLSALTAYSMINLVKCPYVSNSYYSTIYCSCLLPGYTKQINKLHKEFHRDNRLPGSCLLLNHGHGWCTRAPGKPLDTVHCCRIMLVCRGMMILGMVASQIVGLICRATSGSWSICSDLICFSETCLV